MSKGDHIYCHRFLAGAIPYQHHGIDVGDGTVIHYTGEFGSKSNAAIERTSLRHFAAGCEVFTQHHDSCNSPDRVVQLAVSRLGEQSYDISSNNCEHFARWCKTSKSESRQVDTVGRVATASTGAAAVPASLGVISATGAVVGLGGSGMMSGLAAVGGLVGGGAVAGLGVLGAAPALAGISVLNNTVFADNAYGTNGERDACGAARVATYVGAAAGTAGGIATVSAAGAVVGLSGAGIASGLAAVGGVVGGGMAAGAAVVIAAPLAAAAAVGGAIYGLVKLFSDD